MVHFLKSVFAPPSFPDEEKNRVASRLNLMQWFMLGCTTFGLALGLISSRDDISATAFTIAVSIILTMFIARRGDVFFASVALLVLSLGLVTIRLERAYGVHDILMLTYLTLIVIASLILKRAYFIGFILVELAGLAFLVFGEVFGLFHNDYSALTDPDDFFLISAILVLTALAVRLMADDLGQSLIQVRHELHERQQAEQSLRENQTFLSDLIENSAALVFVKNLEGRYELVNRQWEKITGLTRAQVIGRTDLELFPGETGRQFRANDLKVIQAVKAEEVEETLADVTGKRYFHSVKFPLHDANGAIKGVGGMLTETTERHHIENEIRSQSARAQIMAETSQLLSSMTLDSQRVLDFAVQRCAKLIGDGASIFLYDPDSVYLKLATVSNPNPEHIRIFQAEIAARPIRSDEAAYARVITTGQPLLFANIDQEKLKASAPSERQAYYDQLPFYSAMFAPLRAEGKILGVLGMGRHHLEHPPYTPDDLSFLQDIADRTALALLNARLYATLEERVHQRTADLEAANRELESFSYSVSHDLRAPLRAINGYSGILATDFAENLSSEAREYLNLIQKGASQMGELIDGILQFSRLSRQTLHRQMISMKLIAVESYQRLKNNYPDLAVDFILEDLPDAHADAALIQQVFVNLLDNALKYSSRRQIARIEVNYQKGPSEVVYFVRDNGAGFDMRYADKLFGVFQRLHRVEDFDGTGIGLANVKRIINRHGGRVWAESEVDKGATFYFTI